MEAMPPSIAISLAEHLPLEQGLRLEEPGSNFHLYQLAEHLPLEQGLRPETNLL